MLSDYGVCALVFRLEVTKLMLMICTIWCVRYIIYLRVII